jgi:sugar-specific transcriptional regulator TrmB
MKSDVLIEIGLNEPQAQVYRYLLENGATTPPALAKQVKLTRSNTYKVLEQLIEKGLVSRNETNKKLVYQAEDPIVLASVVAEERNRVMQLESNIKTALTQLRDVYQKSGGPSAVQVLSGKEAVVSLYKHQSELKEPIYFIKSRSDIPFMGYETMDSIRNLAVKYDTPRYGLVPDAPEAAINPKIDESSNLQKTWIDDQAYTAPVEWAVSGDELLLVSFSDKPAGIRIVDPVIAEAFRQLWHVMDKSLRANPEYKNLPKKAKRAI